MGVVSQRCQHLWPRTENEVAERGGVVTSERVTVSRELSVDSEMEHEDK